MINLSCNDNFLKNSIVDLLYQKKFFLNISHTTQYFFQSKIMIKEKNLEIFTSANKLNPQQAQERLHQDIRKELEKSKLYQIEQ